ncbi:hypothetical protein Chor_012031 [Crotalus horridus]
MVALCSYEVVKDALIDHSEEFGGRTEMPAHKRLFRNKGLASTNDKKWKELRRFTLSTLRDFGMGKKRMSERVQEEALCLVEEMAATKGQPFDPRRIFSSAVSNVICAVVFGNRFDYKDRSFIENQKIMESQLRYSVSFLGLVQQEIDEVVGTNRTPSMEDRLKMPFTNAVVHEVQRYQKGTLEAFPRATTCEVKFHGYTIPKVESYAKARVQQEIDDGVGANLIPSMEETLKKPFTNAVIQEVQQHQKMNLDNLPQATVCDTKFRGYTIPKMW